MISMRRSWLVLVAMASLGAVACGSADASDGTPGDEEDITSSAARFETFTGVDGQTYFHLVAGNGELVLQSEGYKDASGAQTGVASVKENGGHAASYQVVQAKDGEFYFNLVAGNNQIIATSEMYASKGNADKAVASVKSLVSKLKRWETIAAEPKASFNVFKGIDGQYYFNLRARNGEIVLQSEGYTTKESATKGIASVRANGTRASAFTVFEAADGQYAIDLKASNGEIIAQGQRYSTKSNAQKGASTIAELVGGQPVVPGPDRD